MVSYTHTMKADLDKNAALAEYEYLHEAFGNKSAVADVFGLHRSTPGRWKTHRPDADNEMKIAALRLILLKLRTLYRPETAEKWLLGINAFLRDQRPLDLIKQGRFAEVLSAIEQTEAGGYA
jgi:hypothetical protein